MMNLLQEDEAEFSSRTPFKLKHIRELLKVCLYKTYFLWNNQIHSKEDSGPIGLSLMVVLAEGYLQTLEKRAIEQANSMPIPISPITHYRYVDDSHDRFYERTTADQFHGLLNIQDERIQYTMEYESREKELNYLDVTSCNKGTGRYEYKVYRKPAITNVQVKSTSCHDQSTLNGIFKGFLHRARSICSSKTLQDEIGFITQVFIANGYERTHLEQLIAEFSRPRNITSQAQRLNHFVSLPYLPNLSVQLKNAFRKAGSKVAFKAPRNLGSILTSKIKPSLPHNSNKGVYFTPTGCARGYTGETKKRISTRNKEHEKAIFEENVKDALAEHHASCDCSVETSHTRTLAVEPHYYRRKVRESLEIRRLGTGPGEERGINRDLGDYVNTTQWNNLFPHINNDENADVKTFEYLTSELSDVIHTM